MTPEGRVKSQTKALLKEFGAYQHWPVLNGMGAPTLDCIACHRGRYVAIETKAPGAKPTERQLRTITEMRAARATVFVIDGERGLVRLRGWLSGELTDEALQVAEEVVG